MAISLRVNKDEENLIKAHANLHGVSVGKFIRDTVIEKIEEEYDLNCALEALQEHNKNPETTTLEDFMKENGID